MPTYPTLQSQQVSDGAVNQWVFAETSGTTAVDSIGGANGTYNAPFTLETTSFVSGLTGAVNFSAASPSGPFGYANLPLTNQPQAIAGDFSIEFVYQNPETGAGGPGTLVGNNFGGNSSGWAVYFPNTSEFQASCAFTGGVSTITVAMSTETTTPFLFELAWSNNLLSLFMNGVLQGTAGTSGTYVQTSNNIGVGAMTFSPADDVGPGTFQCLAFYKKALTEFEAYWHYQGMLGASYTVPPNKSVQWFRKATQYFGR